MTKMKYLTLEDNDLSDITPLLGMQKLKWLTLGGNKKLTFDKMFPVVTQLRSLKELNLAGMELTGDEKRQLEEAMPWCTMKYKW